MTYIHIVGGIALEHIERVLRSMPLTLHSQILAIVLTATTGVRLNK